MFDGLPQEMPRVVSVGRLDFNTEGLLLLTNDGALARAARASGHRLAQALPGSRASVPSIRQALARLKEGITIEGIRYGPIEAALDRVQG